MTLTRRQVATGAAWAVPGIAVGLAAPALAASPPDDPCQLTVLPGSFKCCANGPDKTMYLLLQVGYTGVCNDGQPVCILDVRLSNGQSIDTKTVDGTVLTGSDCVYVNPGDTIAVLLQGVHSCAADLVFVGLEGNRIVKSGNIPGGDETECVTRAGS